MDTTEVYIKMCEKAEEIQVLAPKITGSPYDYDTKPNELGSFYFKNKDIEILHYDNDTSMCMVGSYGEEDDTKIWLPRQDQFQEMLNYSNVQSLVSDFNGFVHYFDTKLGFYTARFNGSMEQLWLVFVMKEKWGKQWNGG